jgi:Dolichyl-phosphate-mannose-protein mannosyltransferase
MAGPMRIPGFRRDVAGQPPAPGTAAGTAAEPEAAPPPVTVTPFNRWVIAVGGVVFAIEMALSTRYGCHRDELYFLDCARHLQASYVDQPVLTPLLAWVSLKLFGVSLPGLRVWPALAAWGTVLVAGLIAREFGGGRRAQLLAAIAATMPALLAIDHQFGPTAFDALAWAGLALVVVRIGRTGDTRWWLLGGVVLGLGLANKHSVGFFGLAIFAGVLLSGGRRLVRSRLPAAVLHQRPGGGHAVQPVRHP